MAKAKLLASVSNQFSPGFDAPPLETRPARAAWRVDDAAYRMGVSRVSIYKLAKEGKITLIKIAGRTLVPESEIVRLTTLPNSTEAA